MVRTVLLSCLAACDNTGTTVSIKTDSVRTELEALGEKIEEKAEVVGDSVKARYKDIKENVEAGIDSMQVENRDKTN